MNQEQSKALGALLRQKRQELGYSMTQLAHSAGVGDTTVMRIERGEFAAPRPDKLARLAGLLEIGLADLYAKAGYLVPEELPGLDPYLAAKYPNLSEDDRNKLCRHFDELLSPDDGTPFKPPRRLQEQPDEATGSAT